jgi:hypothetical protein
MAILTRVGMSFVQVACDVCVGGINALLNTALLKFYGQVDPRVRPLVFAVKYWAKQRGINDSVNGTLSSYGEWRRCEMLRSFLVCSRPRAVGYTLLLIFYLQSQYAEMQLPAVHAVFQHLQSQTKISALLERLHSFPVMELPSTFGTSEMNSVGALLAGFFDFYANRFNVEDEVVSIRTGRALSKTTKWSHPASWRLSIEDPFELAHDIGRVIFHRKGQELVLSEFQRASNLLSGDRRLEDICAPDETSWNVVATCYICHGRDHATRDCGQLVRQRLTAGSNAMSNFSDCWYCGEYGHYKAECPMLFFRDIPRPGEMKKADAISAAEATAASGPVVRLAAASPPIAIPVPPAPKTPSPHVCKERLWERGLSPSSSPMLRLSRKKKRARHGSTSSASSPSSSCNSPSSGLSQAEKRQQQQRYQQQRHEQRRRNFAMPEPTRKCGGGNARSGRPHVGKVLCPS